MPTSLDISQQRAQRDAALASALASEARMRNLTTEIAAARRAGQTSQVAQLRAALDTETKAAQSARANAAQFRQNAFSTLGQLLQQTPEQIVGACSATHPFVLLPVRLETKFNQVPGGATELRVRIFPDEISVAAPTSALTDDEIVLGQAYWRARVASKLAPVDTNLANAYSGAWTALAARAGAYRASYVVKTTAPENPTAKPADLIFPTLAAPTEPALPRADALPDRFVVLTYSSDATTGALQEVNRVVGLPIPDDLVLAPDATQADSWLRRDPDTGRIVFPNTLKWMVDFDAAVSVGMAVRIPIAPVYTRTGFARVVAVGVRSATPPEEGPATLEKLLSKHRYGAGFGLLRAGTPTNNTDAAASGWQPPANDAQQLFTLEDNPPDLTPQATPLGLADGARLASLFGLSLDFARRLPNAAATDIAEALAMNRAAVPGTIDNFVSDFLKDVVSPGIAESLHQFFTAWVSGRGHFPALRIGRQPYGVVLTSAWQSWKFSPPHIGGPIPATIPFASQIYNLLNQHRPRWQALARRVPYAGDNASDPFQRLLSIIGLLASSTDFVSRRAVSDEYIRQRLRFGGSADAAIAQWFAPLQAQRGQNLTATSFPTAAGPIDPLLAFMIFTGTTDEWKLPIVDRDPTVPLSEHDPIGAYDGTHNYLQWLTTASRADLQTEHFVDASGSAVAHPTALLYVILRHALLAALETATINAAQTFGSAQFQVIDRDPVIANIGDQQHVLRKDYLEVDASKLNLTPTATTLGDWTLTNGRMIGGTRPAPVQHLGETHDAINALATLPTARLERLLAEHLDLCSYRLDAWITALYAHRLSQMQAQENPKGLYLGAFGWVENLKPAGAERQRISADTLPTALQTSAGPNVFVESNNGGYVHAPSLAQASTAAVLRNGYLSHASSTQPQTFAVNLSSARMRQALALIQGVRNGQPIGALLGYQLERGLHENHPGIELDSYIYVLRDRFPLISGRLNDLPEGTAAETVEARNVVDGLGLLESTEGKTYPFSLDNLPAASTAEGAAIAAEVDRLRDALDAVSDLLLAEGVHQAVQGNFARTKASLQALTQPEAPPEPEVIRTPRSGRVLTFRIALALDATATTGWNASLSPRAQANPALNHWLADRLPAPEKIQWTVNDAGTLSAQSLADFGLEPLDVVLMSGDRLGDSSSELERLLIRRYRFDRQTPDDRASFVAANGAPADPSKSVIFDFGSASAGAFSLARVHPLLVRLRRLLTKSRPAHAGDWRRATDRALADATDPTGSASGDPKLIAFKDLTDRLDTATQSLTRANTELKTKLDALAPLLANLTAEPSSIANVAWVSALNDLRQALFALVPFGVPEAVPPDGLTVTAPLANQLVSQAQAVAKLVDQRLATVAPLRATSFSDPLPVANPALANELSRRSDALRTAYLDAGSTLLGQAFNLIPLYHFQPAQSAELQQGVNAPIVADTVVVDSWIHSVARVRSAVSDLTWATAVCGWIGRDLGAPTVLQLPFRPGTPWIGEKFGGDLPADEWLSIAVLNSPALSHPLQAGLLLDEWTETVPTDKETTGVTFNFNRPNAAAPQAILVAVPPVTTANWAWQDLIASVHEALDLAHMRAVEPDMLIGRGANDPEPAGDYFQVLPAVLSEFSNMRIATIDYAARVNAKLAQS